MKKTNCFLASLIGFLWAFSVSNANGQITFEHSYGSHPEVPVHVTKLENSGDKYVVYDELSAVLYLYNLNHSLWKSISIDTLSIGVSPNSGIPSEGVLISYIKENLFNLDNNVEFVWQLSREVPTTKIAAVINEFGSPIIVFDSCVIIESLEGFYQRIRNTSNGTKLITRNSYTDEHKVYSLPGTLTCDPCGGVSGIANSGNSAGRLHSKAYPVPSEKSVTVQYELPPIFKSGFLIVYNSSGAEVMKLQIGPAFNDVVLQVDSLKSGVYLYSIQAQDGNQVSSGRFIVQ